MSRFENYKKYQVEAESVDDFIKKYSNYNSLRVYIAPHKDRLELYTDQLKKEGFCYMSKFMSVTGQPVTYYPQEVKNNDL